LEPYVISRFARQFRYDQLYVGNPNLNLAFMGSLIDGACAWRFFIAGCTEARLRMLLRTPNLLTTLSFCQWYATSNSTLLEFNVNNSGVKLISQRLKQTVSEKRESKRVRVPGIEEFVDVDDSEASDAESPHFEAEAGAETPAAGSGMMGITPPRHVEEAEEEDPDVPLKRKRTGGSRRKQLVKKSCRQAPIVVIEGEPSAALPSLVTLVVELSVAEPATGEVALDLGRINSVLVIYLICVLDSSLFAL